MPAPRRVAVVTGTRAEYGLLRALLEHLQARTAVELQLIVSGMHLLRRFGYTISDIIHDGFPIAARVPMYTGRDGEVPMAQALALARGITGIARALDRLDSQIVVVLGDRLEAMAAGLATITSGRCLAHIHGGDVAPGHLDDAFRHALTKLAHVHFTAAPEAARRVRKLGEDASRVYVVGAPGLDELVGLELPSKGWLHARFSLDPRRDVALVVHHAIGRSPAVERAVMGRVIRATLGRSLSCIVLHPNCDPGHTGILEAIEKVRQRVDRSRLVSVPSLPRREFLQALMSARVLVGNSSCGIIEAHTAGTPALDVGDRQSGRLCNPGSVVHCGEQAYQIRAGLERALRVTLRPRQRSVYGAGRAAENIARNLVELELSDNLLRKSISY